MSLVLCFTRLCLVLLHVASFHSAVPLAFALQLSLGPANSNYVIIFICYLFRQTVLALSFLAETRSFLPKNTRVCASVQLPDDQNQQFSAVTVKVMEVFGEALS